MLTHQISLLQTFTRFIHVSGRIEWKIPGLLSFIFGRRGGEGMLMSCFVLLFCRFLFNAVSLHMLVFLLIILRRDFVAYLKIIFKCIFMEQHNRSLLEMHPYQGYHLPSPRPSSPWQTATACPSGGCSPLPPPPWR